MVRSLKGCKTVAGGRKTTGSRPNNRLHPERVEDASLAWQKILHPFRVRSDLLAAGGLRFASTSGYSLTTLRVANTYFVTSELDG
jgi:hypothetical protein